MQGNKSFDSIVTLKSYLHVGMSFWCYQLYILPKARYSFLYWVILYFFLKRNIKLTIIIVFFYVQEDFSNTWTFRKITSSFFIISKKFVTRWRNELLNQVLCLQSSLFAEFYQLDQSLECSKMYSAKWNASEKERKLEKMVKMVSALKWQYSTTILDKH